MTTRDIQRRIIADRYNRNFTIPNYTPSKWHECDVFEVTQSGRFVEYEVKMTLADFRADAKKFRGSSEFKQVKRYNRHNPEYQQPLPITAPTKHEMLMDGVSHGPTRFWYVCPHSIIPYDELPEWAGLLYATEEKTEDRVYVWMQTVKPAPQLHRVKVDPTIRAHAESVCYWRFVKLFLRQPVKP